MARHERAQRVEWLARRLALHYDRGMPETPLPPAMTKRRKAAFAALTVALAFLTLEAVLALSGAEFGWEIDAPLAREQLRGQLGKSPMWSDEDLLSADFSIYEDDRTLLWRIRPGLDAELRNFLLPADLRAGKTFRLNTNAGGFRGPEAAPGEGRSLVLCLGGSGTFGWGLDEGEAWPERLLEALERGKPGAFSVSNMAQPGYSSRQGLALWEERGRAASPAWVILEFGFNDGVRAPVSDRQALASRMGPAGFARHALSRTRTYRLARWLALRAKPRPVPKAGDLAPRVSPESYRENLEALVRSCRSAGAKPVLLGMRNKYPDEAAALARGLEIPLVNADAIAAEALRNLQAGSGDPAWREAVAKAFPREALEERPSWWVDADVAHYNRFVHELVARELARILLKEAQ